MLTLSRFPRRRGLDDPLLDVGMGRELAGLVERFGVVEQPRARGDRQGEREEVAEPAPAALYIIGVAGAVVATERLARYRAIAASFLGGALIILGLILLRETAAPLADEPWFREMMEGTERSLVLALTVAAVLTFVVQSSGAVSVFGISLATAGIISVDQAIMTMYGSFIGSAAILTVLSANLTRAPVLDPGRGRTKTGWLWALARDDRSWGGADPPGVVYFYAPTRGGQHAERFLGGFEGILQVDGYAGYTRLVRTRKGVRLAYCWSHARRKLRDVFESAGSKVAAEGLRRIAEFYAIEADIRGASPERRLAERQARTAPLVEDFGVWLREQRARASAKSRFGEALAYIARYWDGLGVFL